MLIVPNEKCRLVRFSSGLNSVLGCFTIMKYLLFDSRIIAKTENTTLCLGNIEKDPYNPLFGEELPWEVRFDNMNPNVLFDQQEEVFKLWYNVFIVDENTASVPLSKRGYTPYGDTKQREMGVCYAVSSDGINWKKPQLGLIDFEGSSNNNIVKRPVHGAGIQEDLHDSDDERRYKIFAMMNDEENQAAIAFSSNGLQWSKYIPCPEMQVRGDTHNNFFWDERLKRYVAFSRKWDGPNRTVVRTESTDFTKWTQAEEVMRAIPEAPHLQTYNMLVFPYAGLYLGLVMIFNSDPADDRVHCELAWSPDTFEWHRICPGQPLIPMGDKGAYDFGCIYAAAYPIFKNDGILLYYSGGDDTHMSWRKTSLCLAHLRSDGFASMQPEEQAKTATAITQPMLCDGSKLQISTDAAQGRVSVSVVGAKGYGIEECNAICDDVTGQEVTWQGRDLSEFTGQRISLCFEFCSAKLYAFDFSD